MAKAKSPREDAGKDQVQAKADRENAAGLAGEKVDPTPDENDSVAGVTSDASTPETDADAARKASDATKAGESLESVSFGDPVKVKTPDGRTIEMSRKAYEMASDKFTLVGGKDK